MFDRQTSFGAAVIALALGLSATSVWAQDTDRESGRRSRKVERAEPAPVPQYWIADASLFIVNAANTAAVLEKEQTLSVQEPMILGNQAEFLVDSVDRALESLDELLENAQDTNPEAVPEIRDAIAELIAAQSQARSVAEAARRGELGPTYDVTVRAALEHLKDAEDLMSDIAKEYKAGDLAMSRGSFRSSDSRPRSRSTTRSNTEIRR
jgi:hypothetical protein